MHTHSRFSFDGQDDLEKMLATAYSKGVAFYGVSEHLDLDLIERGMYEMPNADEYFHKARHLQEDYEGAMNVAVGMEFGFCKAEKYLESYQAFYEKYRPDYVINSVHALNGEDYYEKKPYYEKDGGGGEKSSLKSKKTAYREYFSSVLESLNTSYPYDIVGHIGYCTRYAPYAERSATLADFQEEIDKILLRIIELDKILEVNSSNKGGVSPFLPSREILERYFALGGRKVSFGSDAHGAGRICEQFLEISQILKEIGFTHFTLPFRGEHIKIDL